jgi:hypothetical protein
LLDVQILKIYAGGVSCFAITETKHGLEEFLAELLKANREAEVA